MLRLAFLLLAGVVACETEGRWPGGRGGNDFPPDDFPDAGFWVADAWPVPDAGGPIDGSNILANGGFERLTMDGTFAARWQPEASNPGGSIAIVADPTYTGSRALEFDIAAAGDGYEVWVAQDNLSAERLLPGARYELAGFYRINRVDGGGIHFNYVLQPDSGDPDIENGWDDTHPAEVDTWEPFAWQFSIPADYSAETYALHLHLIKFTSNRIVLQVDEVSLLRVSSTE